jgi:hypothetical protein
MHGKDRNMAAERRRPLEFRKEDVEYITQRWMASGSSSLVGIGSAGKSNLLQHIIAPDVQAHYMGDSARSFKTIVIDANMLGPLPSPTAPDSEQIRCWAGYELMMHRLYLAFYPFDVLSPDEARRFYDTYQALQDGTNPLYTYMALRYFELGIEFFMRKNIKIAFLFDEFEEMLRQMPVKFFQTLRGIRDSNKNRIMYTAFTRSPLPTVIERLNIPLLDIEPFIELFTDNVHYVGPYNETDARQMLDDLARRRDLTYAEPVPTVLLQATGRYAGLVRAAFNALEEFTNINLAEQTTDSMAELLATKPAIRTECRTIWTSLNRSEQYVLKAVARLTPYNVSQETEHAVAMLVQKRLLKLNKAQQMLEIEPPVFKVYVATNPDPS